MNLLVVSSEDLTRCAGDLVWVLKDAHTVDRWGAIEFEHRAAEARGRSVLFLGGTGLVTALLRTVTVRYHRHGVTWGFAGKRAVISADPDVDDPARVLEAIDVELSVLADEARHELDALGPDPDPARFTGVHLAGAFLSPTLHAPDDTARGANWVRFPPERTLWERQYRLGVATFLRKGFDEYARAS